MTNASVGAANWNGLTIERSAAPLRSQVVDELREAIVAGRLAPGTRLMERELIGMTGVSRTVIREALRQLETEGLVAMLANKGPVVRELTVTEATDLYAIRAVLEGLAARLFAERASEAQIKILERCLTSTARAYRGGDPELILAAKNRFYDTLFEGAGSETLSSMLAIVHGRIRRWRALGLSHPRRSAKRWQESLRGLRGMIAAVRQKNADLAEKTIRDEVTRARAEVMRLLQAGDFQKERSANAKRLQSSHK